jgi:Tfp pilus assembly protein PilF/ribosomal protein L40E
MSAPVCSACGARLAPGATQCDLCGHVLGEGEEATPDARMEPAPVTPAEATSEAEASEAEASEEAPADPPAAPEAPEGPFCVHCGKKNPAYARFCYNCGHALHTADVPEGSVLVVQETPVVPAVSPEAATADTPVRPLVTASGTRPDSDPGKRALLLVGAGVLAVLVLFFITQFSQGDAPPAQPTSAASTPAPTAAPAELADEVRAEAATLEDAIAAATTDEERLERQEQLAGLYIQAQAFGRAAEVQEDIAEAQRTALAWADAGSLFLAHMLRTQGPDRATYAQRAAQNYERSLELDPEDLDVKTDLATAYLNDATNPMRAVEIVKEVLEEDPDHVRANFNYGLMLAQINRTDQAQEQFEKVVSLTEPGDPVHQRAEQELARMQSVQGGAGVEGQGGTVSG